MKRSFCWHFCYSSRWFEVVNDDDGKGSNCDPHEHDDYDNHDDDNNNDDDDNDEDDDDDDDV